MTNRLNALRLEKDKSIRDVSNDLDINQTGVWKMEVGKQDPSATYLALFSKYYGVTVDYILGIDSERTRPKPIVKEIPLTFSSVLESFDTLNLKELEEAKIILDWTLSHKKKYQSLNRIDNIRDKSDELEKNLIKK